MKNRCVNAAISIAKVARSNITNGHHDHAWGQIDSLIPLLECLKSKKCKKGKKCNDPK